MGQCASTVLASAFLYNGILASASSIRAFLLQSCRTRTGRHTCPTWCLHFVVFNWIHCRHLTIYINPNVWLLLTSQKFWQQQLTGVNSCPLGHEPSDMAQSSPFSIHFSHLACSTPWPTCLTSVSMPVFRACCMDEVCMDEVCGGGGDIIINDQDASLFNFP